MKQRDLKYSGVRWGMGKGDDEGWYGFKGELRNEEIWGGLIGQIYMLKKAKVKFSELKFQLNMYVNLQNEEDRWRI